jgi:hypothetical protein
MKFLSFVMIIGLFFDSSHGGMMGRRYVGEHSERPVLFASLMAPKISDKWPDLCYCATRKLDQNEQRSIE